MRTGLFIFFILLFHTSQSQLVTLETYKHSYITGKGSIYKQFSFRVDSVNGHPVIKTIKGDKILYDPGHPVFCEVFANNFLVVTSIDTGSIKSDTLLADYLSPRRTIFIIPVTGLTRFKKMYTTDLDNMIVVPDAKIKKAKALHWYRMRTIETVNKKVLFYDRKEMVHQFWFTEILL